ncbi:hypothetical protein ACEN9X_26985 [Mucilaginibacter sp. Mucisp86]|uniref:hypothetical protein n=1 Tax=Mucilaginibacter sp. Mucisp86 TaxID=3243060 RepID=UPI0039B4583B
MSNMEHPHEHHYEENTMAHQHMAHAGHDHSSMIADFRIRFYVVLVLTVPILLLPQMIRQ